VIHFVIPDGQVAPGSKTAHWRWIGEYLVDQFAEKDVRVINIGDFWDMPSLSSYDKGRRAMEGRRYHLDIQAGNDAMDTLMAPLERYQLRQRIMKKRVWQPDLYYFDGNHDDRITRATQDDATFEGTLSLGDRNLATHGIVVHPFLEVAHLDGIAYSHYFVNNMSGRPLGGMIETRIKNIGCSFTMGHQQGLKMGMLETVAGRKRGLIAGSCYLDTMDYRGPQGQNEWRGIVICHEVQEGDYCLMEVSLAWLCQKYEGTTLDKFLGRTSA
jgi:hypothetical protein